MTPADVTAFREKLGLSMAKAALLGGIDRTTLWRWETGRQVPTPADYDHWQRAVTSELRARLDSVDDIRKPVPRHESQTQSTGDRSVDMLLRFGRAVAEHRANPSASSMARLDAACGEALSSLKRGDPRAKTVRMIWKSCRS